MTCAWTDIDYDGVLWRCTLPKLHTAPHIASPCTPECLGRYPQRIGLWRKPKRSWEWRCVEHAGRTGVMTTTEFARAVLRALAVLRRIPHGQPDAQTLQPCWCRNVGDPSPYSGEVWCMGDTECNAARAALAAPAPEVVPPDCPPAHRAAAGAAGGAMKCDHAHGECCPECCPLCLEEAIWAVVAFLVWGAQ